MKTLLFRVVLVIFVLSNILLSFHFSFSSIGDCNILNYINDSTSDGDKTCTSSNGLIIENIQGSIYCSPTSENQRFFTSRSYIITNSQINFVNCELRSFLISNNNISINNSNITFYNTNYETSSLKSTFENEILSDSNSNLWYFEPFLFDIYIGPDIEPAIVETSDIRRNFDIFNSTGNFSTTISYVNTLFYYKTTANGRDMFNIYLPTTFLNSSIENLTSNEYRLEFNISNLNIIEEFDFSGTSSLSSITEIEIEDTQTPRVLNGKFQYNANNENEVLTFEFDKFLKNLSVQIQDLDQSTLINSFSSINNNFFSFNSNLLSSNPSSNNFQITFIYEDYFNNSDGQTIIIQRPQINNSELFSLGTLIYNYSYDTSSILNATLHFKPMNHFSIIDELQFDITPSNTDVLTISNATQIIFNSMYSYQTPNSSSFFNPHKGIIKNNQFQTPPVLLLDNTSYTLTTSTSKGYEYNIGMAKENYKIFNNSKINFEVSSPRYFNRNFEIYVEYLSEIDNSVIYSSLQPSFCQVIYNLETLNPTTLDLTFNNLNQRFEGEIFFTQYFPLDKNVIISCNNTQGFENISKEIIINHTHQPISDFIFNIDFDRIDGNALFTTDTKKLEINITSFNSENTDPTTDNNYYVMFSKVELNALNWNTTQNVTPWINIGKNEEIIISHNDSNSNKDMRVDLENGSFFTVDDSFIFRDERDGNNRLSLFTIVKSCVPEGVCEIVSDSSEFFIFQDTTPPIVYEFNIREITNNEHFQLKILVDDLESDMQNSNLILTNSQDSNDMVTLNLLEYNFNTTSLFNAPLTNKNLIEEGVLYNISILSSNANELEEIFNSQQTLLLDNQPPTGSSIKILDSFDQNTSSDLFYLSNSNNIGLNISAGLDIFQSYEFNAGISHYELIVYEQSNNCNTQISEQFRVSNNISDNQSEIISVNLSSNICNRLVLNVYDFAGNIETVSPLNIIIDSTPPKFNTVLGGGNNIAIVGENNAKIHELWNINNQTTLFEYVFDIVDDLSPIKNVQINLYERIDNTSPFIKVEEFVFDGVKNNKKFTINDFNFKDGKLYKIGVIATNFANLSTQEEISSAVFLSLTNRVEIEPSGVLKKNSDSIFYFEQLVTSNTYDFEFTNLNLAPIQCQVSNITTQYELNLPNQCSLEDNNSIVFCPTLTNSIENSDQIFVNCFIDNSDKQAQNYFSIPFNVVKSDQNLNVNVSLNLNSLINNESGLQSIQTNFNPSNTQESYFNITTPHFNNSNILISWVDNNTNQWNFTSTQILVENKTFENESLIGSRISILNFPKFDSNKSISIPSLENSSNLAYCVQDDDSNNISSQCNSENEFLVTSCNTSISSSISCIEENSMWKIQNLKFTTIENVCLESWNVGSWSSCSGGVQTRTVTPTHNCGSNITRPKSSRSCSISGGSTSSGGSSRGSSSSSRESYIVVSPPTNQEENTSTNFSLTPPSQNNDDSNLIIVEPEIEQNNTQNETKDITPSQPQITIPSNQEEEVDISVNPSNFSFSNFIIVALIIILLISILSLILILKKKNNIIKNYIPNKSSSKINSNTSYYNQNLKLEVEKNLNSLSIIECNSLKEKIRHYLQKNKAISTICVDLNIKREENIKKILELSGFSNYLVNLENEIRFNKNSVNTNIQIEQLLQKQWFYILKPNENLDNYLRDLGFFITKFKMTNVFSTKELEEIFIDSIIDNIQS